MSTVVNRKRLFAASCISLLLTAMTFAFRARLETVFGPEGAGLTLEQIGSAFAPAFWGFTLAMIFGGYIVEVIGMRKGMILAAVFHAAGIVGTLFATDYQMLFWATVFVGLGNGMVEAVCNPMVASAYPDQKVKMLNRFHLWFPGGIAIGSVIGYLVMDVMGLSWQIMVGLLFIPLVAYIALFKGQEFPETQRVALGVSAGQSMRSLLNPLYLFIGLCMMMSAATELGTNQRIESLLKDTGVNGLLVLAYINALMMIGRFYAGPINKRLSTAGMLWFSAIFSFIGLWLMASASGAFVFFAAAVFAIGITFFWPTTLSFVAENMPETSAMGLSVMGGLGMLSVSIVLPVMGRILDNAEGGEALTIMSILPGILIVFYGALFFLRRGKQPVASAGH